MEGIDISSLPKWPIYATFVVSHPIYKLESRKLYIDVPHVFLFMFINELLELPSKMGINIQSFSDQDIAKLYEESIKISEKINRKIKESGIDWLKVSVIWRQDVSKKPLRIRYKITWKKFFNFLEEYAASDISLIDKYEEYIFYCRENFIRMLVRGYDLQQFSDFIDQVKEIAGTDIQSIENKINDIIDFLKQFQKKLYRRLQTLKRKYNVDMRSHVLFYLQEFISFLKTIDFLTRNGLITASYREMRRLLETLCWALFDDLLCLRIITKLNIPTEKLYDVDSQYRIIRRVWYNWAKSNKAVLNTYKEINEKIGEFERLMDKFLPNNIKEKIAVKDLLNLLIRYMVYHLFGLIFGEDAKSIRKKEWIFPMEMNEEFIDIVLQNITYVLRKIAKINVHDFNHVLSDFIQNILKNKPKKVIMPYLSNSAMIYFVEKITDIKGLRKKYDEYSYFIHTYTATWQGIPFSSILEIKILKNEIQKLESHLKDLLTKYYALVFKI